MKELKKLALILRALGINANVVNEEITYNGVHDYDNIFCECNKGLVHFTFKNTLVYDTLYLDSLIQVVSEITSTITKFEG